MPRDAQNGDLHQVGEEDRALVRAETAEDGDGLRLARQIGAQRGGDADAADGQTGEAHEDQERAETLDEFGHARRPVSGVGPAHAAAFEGVLGLCPDGVEICAGGQVEAVMRGKERAGFEQSRAVQRAAHDDGAGAEAEAAGAAVGFPLDHGAQGERFGAQRDGVAGGRAKAVSQGGVHDEAIIHQRLIQGNVGGKAHRAHEGIGGVDGFHLRQAAFLAEDGHGAEIGDLGDLRGGVLHPRKLVRVGEAVGQFDFRVAAQERGAFLGEALGDALADGADGGDGRDAEDHAGKEDAEPVQAAAQFAGRKACGEPEFHAVRALGG